MTSGERLSGPSTEEAHRERSRWMSLGGAIVSGWFLIVILAMEIPHLMLKECR